MAFRERQELLTLHRGTSAASGGVLFTCVSDSPDHSAGARMLMLPNGDAAGDLLTDGFDTDLLRGAADHISGGATLHQHSGDHATGAQAATCEILLESAQTLEAHALLDALEATLHDEVRIVATLLPHRGQFARFIMDAQGDVVFATEALPTEDIVDLRRAALTAAHGDSVTVAAYRLFVERLHPQPPLGALHERETTLPEWTVNQ